MTYSPNSVWSDVVLDTCIYIVEVAKHLDIGMDGLYKHH